MTHDSGADTIGRMTFADYKEWRPAGMRTAQVRVADCGDHSHHAQTGTLRPFLFARRYRPAPKDRRDIQQAGVVGNLYRTVSNELIDQLYHKTMFSAIESDKRQRLKRLKHGAPPTAEARGLPRLKARPCVEQIAHGY
jgi:hypothetical protein